MIKNTKNDKKLFSKTDCFELYCGSACDVLNNMKEESVDMIFADPPYMLSNDGTTCHAGRRVSVNKGGWDKSKGVENDFKFHKEWIESCRKVLKANGTLWISGSHHSIYACGFALQSSGWHILNDICWYKPNAAPHLACRMFAHSHESLIWARKNKSSKHYFNYKLMKNHELCEDFLKNKERQMRSVWGIKPDDTISDMWSVNTPPKSEKLHGKHPAQKPLALLERIVLSCSEEGATILDPFCGSATTGVASLKHGRRFIGIDEEEKYLKEIAKPRLIDILNQKNSSNNPLI